MTAGNSRPQIKKHCIQSDCVHQLRSTALCWFTQPATLPSDSRRRRAEEPAVHYHSLPLHSRVILPVCSQNHGCQICKKHAAQTNHQFKVVRMDVLMQVLYHGGYFQNTFRISKQ